MIRHRCCDLRAFSLLLAMGCGAASSGDDGPGDGSAADDDAGSSGLDDAASEADDGPGSSADDDADDDAPGDGSDSADEGGSDSGGIDPGECGAIATFEDGASPSVELHVAPDGSDGGGCGSIDSPCATIEGAAAQAGPGTAIRVHAGTYAGGLHIGGLAGTADAPIWIGGAPGEDRPVFEGGDVAMQLSLVRYLVLHDLEVRNMVQNGINIDDGGATADPDATRYLVLRGLYIHDIGTGGNNDCLKLSGVNDYAVLDSEFSVCGGGSAGSGIDQVGCHQGIVARSHFHDMQASGNAVQTKGGSEDVEVWGNVFDHAGERALNMGGSTGFEYFRPPLDPGSVNAEARNIRAVANVFIGSMSPVALVGCVDCLVAHNTIVDPEHWVLRVLQETTSTGEYQFAPSGDNRVVNNIVVFSRTLVGTVVNVGPDTAPETFEFANNLWFATDQPDASDPQLPAPEQDGVVGVDPGLADPAAGDVAIGPDSPAAGAGLPVEGTRGDHHGACWGDPPSIGALEVPR